jgi:hypothetical protein
MQPLLENWTVVIVGNWNVHIFNPQWLGEQLFSQPQIEVEVAVSSGSQFFRFRKGDLLLIPSNDRVVIGLLAANDETLLEAEKTAVKLLELLPHTPVRAVGLNFGYQEDEPAKSLTTIFDLSDHERVSSYLPDQVMTQIKRTLLVNERNCNMSLAFQNGIVTLDLNFHFDVENADEATDKVRDSLIQCKNDGIELLETLYEITPRWEDDS